VTEPLADRLAPLADNPCTRVMVPTELLHEAVEALRGIAAIIDPEGGGIIEPALTRSVLDEDDLNDLRQILGGIR
jgi:hypothetical protein